MSDDTPAGHAPTVRNHWWWRPGMRPGRRVYTWHITFGTDEALHQHVAVYQQALADLENLDLVPHEWLHLTAQGIGFTDEVPSDVIDAIVADTRQRLQHWRTFDLQFGRPIIRPEAVAIHPTPGHQLIELRQQLRASIAHVRGNALVEGPAEGFQPHVSIAYVNTEGDSAPIAQRIEQVDEPAVSCHVDTVSLIRLHRDNRGYEWETEHEISFPVTSPRKSAEIKRTGR